MSHRSLINYDSQMTHLQKKRTPQECQNYLPEDTLIIFCTQSAVTPALTSLVSKTVPLDDQYAAVPSPSGCELFHYQKSS